jgi:hypothetical protein
MSANGHTVHLVRVVDEHGTALTLEVCLVHDGERMGIAASNGRRPVLFQLMLKGNK